MCGTPIPMEGRWKFQRGGESQQPKFIRESVKLNWKFLGGGRVQTKKAFHGGGLDIFQNTQCIFISEKLILGNPGLQRGWGAGRKMGARKKRKRRGRGRGRKRAKGSPGNLLYTEHFLIKEQTPLARCETKALVRQDRPARFN